jgi:hypothetical protein
MSKLGTGSKCADCLVSTTKIHEYYIVTDALFALRANRLANLDREGPLASRSGFLAKSFSLLFAGLRVLVPVMLVAWATLAITIQLTLALAARRARGNVCSFCNLCVFSLSTTLDWPSRNCCFPRRSCLGSLFLPHMTASGGQKSP